MPTEIEAFEELCAARATKFVEEWLAMEGIEEAQALLSACKSWTHKMPKFLRALDELFADRIATEEQRIEARRALAAQARDVADQSAKIVAKHEERTTPPTGDPKLDALLADCERTMAMGRDSHERIADTNYEQARRLEDKLRAPVVGLEQARATAIAAFTSVGEEILRSHDALCDEERLHIFREYLVEQAKLLPHLQHVFEQASTILESLWNAAKAVARVRRADRELLKQWKRGREVEAYYAGYAKAAAAWCEWVKNVGDRVAEA